MGTAGLDSAAAYLARRFAESGLEPGGTDGFLQRFTIDPSAPAVAHSGLGGENVANVVGWLPGRGPLADETVILGAHYDHLGLGGAGSLDPDSTGVVHNGADDNASGTAALLEAARQLHDRSVADRRAIVFVAFTAEELGLLGSEHYARHPIRPLESTIAMINFDMVGRLRGDSLVVIGTGSADEWRPLLDSLNAGRRFVLTRQPDPWGRSDHSSFYARGIPVVHLFTDLHEDYHRTTDDTPKIAFEGVAHVATFAADLAWILATRPAALTYAEVEQPRPSTTGGYGAYLGTIPDMTESPGGVRLTGVRAGSPAEAAGLRAGDILIRLGRFEVNDLYDMTDALRAHRPGDRVELVVLRNGRRVETTATLGERGG